MILVTGGLGMIGAHTARSLVDLGHDVVVTAHRRRRPPAFLGDGVHVEPLDVTDRDAFLALGARHGITAIVHLAGSIPATGPVDFLRADTAGLLNAIEAARRWDVDRFAVASSLGVYAGRPEVPWTEDLPLATVPLPHPIVAFKKAAETLTLEGLRGSDVRPVVLRIGSTWGPLMDPESPFNAVPPIVSAVLRGEQPPALPGDGADFSYGPDTGRAIAHLAVADALRHDVYNVSGGRAFTGAELARALEQAVPGARLQALDGRAGDGGGTPHLDISRLRADTGFEPAFTLAEAVADYVAWRTVHDR